MVKFLLYRPIAVLATLLALVIFSIVAMLELPVSLLPDTEVPRLTIVVNYPNASPIQVEKNVLSAVREGLATMNGLEGMESIAYQESGTLELTFEHNTSMDLAYVAANEKIDRLTAGLPNGLERPLVIRTNASDIPVLRIQVVPKNTTDLLALSRLTQNILKKRIEQLEGVSLVDINGMKSGTISVVPEYDKLFSLGINEQDILQIIQENNRELGGISIRDGQYRYLVKLKNLLDDWKSVASIPIRLEEGTIIRLQEIAKISSSVKKNSGFHTYHGQEALVIAVHKQDQARMNELVEEVRQLVEEFKKDYPEASFFITQDKSKLLTFSINNLLTSLVFGGFFAFLTLFFFMGNIRTPLIMGLSLPTSLILSLLVFLAFDLSINIISISGLALGLGMLIDNAIIVLDNITQKRKQGHSLTESCSQGVNEVMPALISSVLTTLAVFVPLIFLGGVSGTLFFDQAVSIAAILLVSLLVAFVLLPLLYRLFFKSQSTKEDSQIFNQTKKGYERIYEWTKRHRVFTLTLFTGLFMAGVYAGKSLDLEGLPPVEQSEKLVKIDWNEPVDAQENRRRVTHWLESVRAQISVSESDIGLHQFILNPEKGNLQQTQTYLTLQPEALAQSVIAPVISSYPRANIQIENAPNAFDQLFSSSKPYWQAKLRSINKETDVTNAAADQIIAAANEPGLYKGPEFDEETAISLSIDIPKLSFYGVRYEDLLDKLRLLFTDHLITEVKSFGSSIPIYLQTRETDIKQKLERSFISNDEGINYPFSSFISLTYSVTQKMLRADWSGPYQGISANSIRDADLLENRFRELAAENNILVGFDGAYYDNLKNSKELLLIFTISVLLLYFILVAQFESFLQPLIVIFTLPIGVAGSMLALWLSGSSLNIMSGIGIIIMLGIIVNDSILKIDTINRLISRQIPLQQAVRNAGALRLKPILMTSLTTILALAPILFTSGLGSELQQPLVYSVIGGLTFGTIASLFFIPLAYSFISRG